MGYELHDFLGGVAREIVEDRLVDVPRDTGVRVPEGFGDDLDIHSGGEHQGGSYVAKVVEPDGREAGGLHQAFEEVADFAGVEERTVFLREDPAGVLPGVAPCLPFLLLTRLVREKAVVGLLVESDQADTAVSFWRPSCTSQPSWTSWVAMVSERAFAEWSSHRTPQPSPRRVPRKAMSRQSMYSRSCAT